MNAASRKRRTTAPKIAPGDPIPNGPVADLLTAERMVGGACDVLAVLRTLCDPSYAREFDDDEVRGIWQIVGEVITTLEHARSTIVDAAEARSPSVVTQ